jgi:hypothetical protein
MAIFPDIKANSSRHDEASDRPGPYAWGRFWHEDEVQAAPETP